MTLIDQLQVLTYLYYKVRISLWVGLLARLWDLIDKKFLQRTKDLYQRTLAENEDIR